MPNEPTRPLEGNPRRPLADNPQRRFTLLQVDQARGYPGRTVGEVMAERATDCPECKGKGTVGRSEFGDDRKWLEVFPRLCDRCGGTGKVADPRPGTEGS